MNFMMKARFFSHDPLQASLLEFMVTSTIVALLNTMSPMKAIVEYDNPNLIMTVDVHFAYSQNVMQSKEHV